MGNYVFDEVLAEYMEGHLSLEEAERRMNSVGMNPEQAAMWNTLGNIDQAMQKRSDADSQLPWLELKVSAQIDARARARKWLSESGGVFGREWSSVAANPVLWKVTGALIIGGLTGYLSATSIPQASQYLAQIPVGGPLAFSTAVFFGLAGALAVLAPSLTKYYK